ncbi:hypothetical protein L1F30_10470 [Simiduia sp. 21SJ11W-1]|uniref:hypothetical protein n=1 Tax=Simiduia sp. 21SJ11W-1 TaxID=2909669 RepID=UPI0020A035F0|nr:hypothetical protein [Simiduia sp. 21SJ11W-1]UTA46588.1 hypothetical protein L1F30_10470 [Simiduia sp. 21SJ11W-1]
MSWQQVNLYLPELQPERELITTQAAVSSLVAVVLLCALVSGFDWLESNRLKAELGQLQAEFTQGQQHIDELLANMPRSQAATLQRELDETRAELARRERIYELIQRQNLGNSAGFSEQLMAMARQHQPELSLTGFGLLMGGQKVALAGNAKTPEAVPQYLQRLQFEAAFKQAVFGNLLIERTGPKAVQFQVSHEAQVSLAGGANGRP